MVSRGELPGSVGVWGVKTCLTFFMPESVNFVIPLKLQVLRLFGGNNLIALPLKRKL